MPHSRGARRGTRKLFQRDFRKSGFINLSTYMQVYKLGDYVDLKANGAIHKGMPHKYYHGRTGRVWNVSRRALGVEVTKTVRGKVLKKRLHVRIEHLHKSTCRQDFLDRVATNEAKRADAKKTGNFVQLKRQPAGPRDGHIVKVTKGNKPQVVTPVAYEFVC